MRETIPLGRGLELQCDTEHVWLIFKRIPGRSSLTSALNLTITARNNPSVRQCLIAWLEEHAPESSTAARRYLEEFEPHG